MFNLRVAVTVCAVLLILTALCDGVVSDAVCDFDGIAYEYTHCCGDGFITGCANNLIHVGSDCVCDRGTWQTHSSSSGDSCIPCSPGTYQGNQMCWGSCYPCPAGTYQPYSGQSSCISTRPGVAWPNGLAANQYMRENDWIPFTAPNQQPYFAVLQGDGNFCVYPGIYANKRQPSVWCSGSPQGIGQPYFAIMQGDGNFAVYHGAGPSNNLGSVWMSGVLSGALASQSLTLGGCGVLMASHDNGTYWKTPADTNGCVYVPGPGVAYPNGLAANQYLSVNDYIPFTAPNQQPYFAVLQADGNFCVYAGIYANGRGPSVWCSGSAPGVGQPYYAIMQGDGNVVVYHGTGPADQHGGVWMSGVLSGALASQSLTLGSCGVLYAQSNGVTYWTTLAVSYANMC